MVDVFALSNPKLKQILKENRCWQLAEYVGESNCTGAWLKSPPAEILDKITDAKERYKIGLLLCLLRGTDVSPDIKTSLANYEDQWAPSMIIKTPDHDSGIQPIVSLIKEPPREPQAIEEIRPNPKIPEICINGTTIRLTGETFIGAIIPKGTPYVSSTHACISFDKNGALTIMDKFSRHGTYIDQGSSCIVEVGKLIEIGSLQYEVLEMNITARTVKMKAFTSISARLKAYVNREWTLELFDCIGQKEGCKVQIIEDERLGPTFAQLKSVNERLTIVCFNPTDHMMLRLSKEKTESKPFIINSNCRLRFGATEATLKIN